MKYSVIDISSSSLSVIVAEAEGKRTEIIFKERIALSLVHYLEGRRLLPRGMDKLTEGLKELKEACANLGAERCYLISTAALRQTENFDEIAACVREATGLPVNALDGKTEAYCDYIANVYYSTFERPVLVDLGGKSIEICDLSKSEKEEMLCLPFGLLDLYKKFIRKIYPDKGEAKEIKAYLNEKFDRAGLPGEGTYSTAVMVGAANAAMYEIYADFANEKSGDGVRTIDRKRFKKLVRHLLTGEDRSRLILNNAPEKLYLIGSAAIVLKTLFKRFDVRHVIVSDRGVKEGYLQLVLEEKETGLYCDLTDGTVGGAERACAAPDASAGKKRAKKRTRAADGAKGSAPEGETVPKKRGRPKKTAPAETGTAAPEGETVPKKRGRPKKTALAETGTAAPEGAPGDV